MDLWLIRHGESEANAGGLSTTLGATPLTDRGHRQAKAVAKTFADPPRLIVVSSFVRSKQTADHTCARFAYGGFLFKEWPVQEWSFLDPERYCGTTKADRTPAVQEYLQRSDPDYRDSPGAESFTDLIARIRDVGDRLDSLPEVISSIAVFTHERFIKAFLWKLFCESVVPKSAQVASYCAFADSFTVPNCLMLQLKRGPYGWFLHGRRDVRLQADEARTAPG